MRHAKPLLLVIGSVLAAANTVACGSSGNGAADSSTSDGPGSADAPLDRREHDRTTPEDRSAPPDAGDAGEDDPGPADAGADVPTIMDSGGDGSGDVTASVDGGDAGAPDAVPPDGPVCGDCGVDSGTSESGGADSSAPEAGANETGTPESGIADATAESGAGDATTDAGCTVLTVKNYASWCSVSVGAGAPSIASVQTVCEPPGVVNLSATPRSGAYELGTMPWHDTTTQSSGSATIDIAGDAGTQCVWVCCPFSPSGAGCPPTDQCP